MVFEKKERIYKDEFNKILHSIADLSPEERGYLNQVFGHDLIDGLTEWELKTKINSLRYNKNDNLEQLELDKLKAKLLIAFGK